MKTLSDCCQNIQMLLPEYENMTKGLQLWNLFNYIKYKHDIRTTPYHCMCYC